MAGNSTVGSTLHITLIPPTAATLAAYNTLFTTAPIPPKVGEIGDFGEFGKEWTIENFNNVEDGGTQKFKTTFDEGRLSLSLLLDNDDAGQAEMNEANDSYDNAFAMITTQNGSRYFMPVLVSSFKIILGAATGLKMASSNLEINRWNGVGVIADLV